MALRCKLSGHDPDACGVCKRCGDSAHASHDWNDVPRERPCIEVRQCSRCDEERERPDHDWEASEGPAGDMELACSRCGLKI